MKFREYVFRISRFSRSFIYSYVQVQYCCHFSQAQFERPISRYQTLPRTIKKKSTFATNVLYCMPIYGIRYSSLASDDFLSQLRSSWHSARIARSLVSRGAASSPPDEMGRGGGRRRRRRRIRSIHRRRFLFLLHSCSFLGPLLKMVVIVPQHRSSHQGVSNRRDAGGKHEEQRRDAKVRYRLADLQPRALVD